MKVTLPVALTPMERQIWTQAYVSAFLAIPASSNRDRENDAIFAIRRANEAVQCLRDFARLPQQVLQE